MTPGIAVIWKEKPTRVRSLETIVRADGSPLECAVLECNRFVRISELRLESEIRTGERHDVSQASDLQSRYRSNEQDSPPVALKKSPRASQKTNRVADAIPLANQNAIAPCNILAVDFLNILVRAWHVGKPTETHAVRSFFQTLANAIRKTNPAHVVIALDGGHRQRTAMLPEYKAHRPESDPNLTEQKALAEWALSVSGFQTVRIIDWEADDVLASIAAANTDVVIASSDKDLLARSGINRCRIYHPWGEGEFVTPESKLEIPAAQVTDFLALCGDASDGIPGVPGIGPTTAKQLLDEFDNLESILTMAHLQRIHGASGKKLREHRDTALLCRRVVELNTTLKIELNTPPVGIGFQQRLTERRLGSVAAIVDSLAGTRFRTGERHGLSHPSEQTQPGSTEDSRRELKQQTAVVDSVTNAMADNRCFLAGQRCRRRDDLTGAVTENPFRRDTENWSIWKSGYDGETPVQEPKKSNSLF